MFKKLSAAVGFQPPMQQQQQQMQQPPMQQQQQQQMQQPPMQQAGRQADKAGISLIHYPASTAKSSDELIAVVVTICGGSSYDNMYRQIPQEGPAGTRIACYGAEPNTLAQLQQNMTVGAASGHWGKGDEDARQLCKDISEVDPDSVVFNWECCSGCSNKGFGQAGVLDFMGFLIQRGHMVMCSDFSLKALVATWGDAPHPVLGPNPFVQVGEFSDRFSLSFDPTALAACPSSQLQKVGDLCPDGHANVHAMGGTIVYSVDKAKADNSTYKCDILSVISKAGMFEIDDVAPSLLHKVPVPKDKLGDIITRRPGSPQPDDDDQKTDAATTTADVATEKAATRGVCGHALLTYESGGKMLTSCGHWIELIKLDVSEENLVNLAQQEYGQDYYSGLQAELDSCGNNAVARKEVVQKRACRMVQSSAPSEYAKGYGRSKACYKGKVRKK